MPTLFPAWLSTQQERPNAIYQRSGEPPRIQVRCSFRLSLLRGDTGLVHGLYTLHCERIVYGPQQHFIYSAYFYVVSAQMMDAKLEVKRRHKSSRTEREGKMLEAYKDSLDKLQGFDYEMKKLPRIKDEDE